MDEFHQHGGWSVTNAGRLTHTLWQPCFNPPAKGSSFKTDERQDMQKCLKFHVRFIDLGLFFHVLISPVNIWAERLWAEISLNMNKSACVNVIWISAFHLSKCQSRREGIIIGNWMMRPLLFQTNILGFFYGGPDIHICSFFSVDYMRLVSRGIGKFNTAFVRAWQVKEQIHTHNDHLGYYIMIHSCALLS